MAYFSKRDQLNQFIEVHIIPAINQKDLDYYLIRDVLVNKTGSKASEVEECLNNFIKLGKIKEVRILTISDEKLNDFLKDLQFKEKAIKEADMEMSKIEQSTKTKEEKK